MPISLSEFIREEQQRLAAFARMWEENMAKDVRAEDGSPIFPAEMEPVDWDDQYLSYIMEDESE